MSAIAGLYHLDQQPIDPHHLTQMISALAAYGPDRPAASYCRNNVGLAHCLRIITPEDHFEQQPVANDGEHHLLVSDARLDNRPEVADALGILPVEARTLPDSALILSAYARWGEECPRHLIGDYAFALWDRSRQTLMLVRSPLGRRPLYYSQVGQTFAFASMPVGLWALPMLPRRLHMMRLAARATRVRVEPEQSLFEGIFQVLPGHLLILSPRGQEIRKFWELDLDRRIYFPRDEEYVEAFNELFGRVVKRMLRSDGGVGVSLSGGLDSSAVAAVAAAQLAQSGESLAGFTEVPRPGFVADLPARFYADETPLVQALARHLPNLDLNLVDTSGRTPFDELGSHFDAMQAPFSNVVNRTWIDAIQEQAQARGVRVLLTGERGNLTLSWSGNGLLRELIAQGKILRAWQEAHTFAGADGIDVNRIGRRASILLGAGIVPLLPKLLRDRYALWRDAQREDAATNGAHHLHPLRADVLPHLPRPQRRSLPPMPYLAQTRSNMLVSLGFGDYEAASVARFGVDRRDPTGALRLVEFCFALPETQYAGGGQRRLLARRAMKGKLPAEILNNTRRGVQAADWHERLTLIRPQLLADLDHFASSPVAADLLNLPLLRRLITEWPSGNWYAPEIRQNYQQILLPGLMLGHFILWFEGANKS